MTAKQTEQIVKEMKEFARKTASSPDKAREFLAKTGVYTKKGQLKKQYK